jgi:hypothetical protein
MMTRMGQNDRNKTKDHRAREAGDEDDAPGASPQNDFALSYVLAAITWVGCACLSSWDRSFAIRNGAGAQSFPLKVKLSPRKRPIFFRQGSSSRR